jgi:hypothetical protein
MSKQTEDDEGNSAQYHKESRHRGVCALFLLCTFRI